MSTLTINTWGKPTGNMYGDNPPATFIDTLLQKAKHYTGEAFAFAAIPIVEHAAVKRGRMQKTDSVFYEWSLRLVILWWSLFFTVLVGTGYFAVTKAGEVMYGQRSAMVQITANPLNEDESSAIAPIDTVARYEVIESGNAKTHTVNFGTLTGVNVGKWEHAPTKNERNLNSLYTGVEGIVPALTAINECEQFKTAWRAKLARKEVTGATLSTIPYIISQFCTGTRRYTNVETLVSDINKTLPLATASIDFVSLCADVRYQLSQSKCEILREVAEKTTGEELVAYGLTELMPAQKKGLLNTRLFDHMLRNCSLECAMAFPALNDKMASVGFWQFTSYAVYRTRRDGKDARGASIVSLYAGENFTISTSVVGDHGLSPEEHILAAHYFGLHNVALLLRYSSDKEVSEFKRIVESGRVEDVLTFKAIAHHLPSPAITRTRSWLAKGAKSPLREALGPALTIYAIKTHYNLVGLAEFLKK